MVCALTAHALVLLWYPDRIRTLRTEYKKKKSLNSLFFITFLYYISCALSVLEVSVVTTPITHHSSTRSSYFILNLMDECQRFLTALSVLPGNNLAISASHQFPNFS
jgi:hypothetical protein